MKRILQTIAILLLLARLPDGAAAQNGHDLLQQALRKERIEGDLKGAIELYQQIATEHVADRALAAQALVQMGKGYEQLGAVDARKAYERVIADYADQSKEVAEAKERLKSLDRQVAALGAERQLTIHKITPEKSDHWDHWVSWGDTRPSPDGRYFAYVNWTHGNLAVCDLQSGDVRDLTKEGTWAGPDQFTSAAIWSPDSGQIAYIWVNDEESDLRIIDRAGGKPRILVPADKARSIAPCDWSKDGRFIVGRARRNLLANEAKKRYELVRVDVATGKVQVVADLPDASANVSISLSPDGRYVAYDTKPRGKDAALAPPSRIHVARMDGSRDRVLFDHPAVHSSPYWTPDGAHLLFLSNRSGEQALWLVSIKDGAAVREPRLIRGGMEGARTLGFTDDGTFFYTASTPRMNVFVAEADFDAGTMQPARLVSLRHDGKNDNPKWSADGSQLAYVSFRSADWPPPGALVFQETATGKEREVVTAALNFFSPPLWAPDLSRLVGNAKVPGRDNQSQAFFSVDAKTSQRSILLDVWGNSANLTADGKSLIYRRHIWEGTNAGHDLIERELNSGRERVITHRATGFNDTLVLSPDGTRLAYCERPYSTTHDDPVNLFITSRADGTTRSVAEYAEAEASVLDWLPDRRRVLVSVIDRKGAQQLRIVDTETKADRAFGEPLRGGDRVGRLSVHPDGKRVAYSKGGVLQEIWTVKNIVLERKEPLGALGGRANAPDGGQLVQQKIDADKLGRWVASVDSSLSPDGRCLAYVNWKFGNLAVCDTWTAQARDLTVDGTWDSPEQFSWRSVWSPDGGQIAFVWYKGEAIELRVVDRNGGTPRVLVPFEPTGGIQPYAWSKDGRFIVGLAPIKRPSKDVRKVSQIVRVDVSSGAVTVVKELAMADSPVSLALSPDAKAIIYSLPKGQLRIVGIDGANDRVVLDQPTGTGRLVWMPNGKHLVFSSNRSGTEALWALPLTQGQADGSPILVRDGFFHSTLLGATDDGTLCWITATPRANVFLADADFRAGTMGSPVQASDRFDGRSRHPRWSGDGSALAYVSRQFPGAKDATHVIRDITSGKEVDVVVPALGYWGPPQWSADHRTFYARAALEGPSAWALYRFDAQTGRALPISEQNNAGSPNLTPDQKHLIYLRAAAGRGTAAEIVERELASGHERIIRQSAEGSSLTKMNSMMCLNPLLSPRGSRLAFLEKSGTNTLLQLITRADGATRTLWSITSGRAKALDWLPEDQTLLVSVEDNAGEEEVQRLHLVDTQTGVVRPFGQPLSGRDIIFQLSVHPDGKRVAFCRGGEIREAWTMKNFLATAR